jgi:hypothetical protein
MDTTRAQGCCSLKQISAEVIECVELYLNFSNTPSWRGVQLQKKAQGQLYIYLR